MKRKLTWVITLTLALCMMAGVGVAEAQDGETLAAWQLDAGWRAFYTYTQEAELDDAWEAAAAAFGPALGMEDMDGATLKAMNAQVCGLPDGIVRLEFDGESVRALDAAGQTVFEHAYQYVAALPGALEEADVFVYHTEDADAGQFAYLCMTLPSVAAEEGGVITNFSLRYAEADYEALFAADYAGATGMLVAADTALSDVDYTIRLVYGAEPQQ